MTNPFRDQEKFMISCRQTVSELNEEQFKMYVSLIAEEYQELLTALDNRDAVETLDALIDILVVTIGAAHSMGADPEGAWREVMATNFAKVDRHTGIVNRREDGKILKPEGWEPPQLAKFVKRGS